MILETIIFFLVIFGFGLAACRWIGLDGEPIEAMAVGLGAACLDVLLLGFFGFLTPAGFLPVALVSLYGWFGMWTRVTNNSFPIPDKDTMIAILLGLCLAYMFAAGSDMPWLEDNDPVEHSSGLVYIGEFHSILQPVPTYVRYLAPYPALYDAFISIPYQMTLEAPAALKLVNAVLCGLAIPFAYIWLRQRYGKGIALWTAFILFALPSFMSHFIWAQTLAIVLMFPALYCYEKRKSNEKYSVPFLLFSALVFITQPSVAFIFGLIMLLHIAFDRSIMSLKLLVAAGLAAALLYWIPVLAIYGVDNTLNLIHVSVVTGDDSSGGVIYSIMDLIDVPINTKIDQAVGWGIGVFLLVVIGIIYAFRDNHWLELAFLLFGIVGIEGNMLPFKLFPHRFWVFLAIPVAILAGMAAVKILEACSKSLNCTVSLRYIILIVMVGNIVWFSLNPKMEVQMMDWPPGMFSSQNQFVGYMHLQQALPPRTLVYDFCSKETMMDGIGLRGLVWDAEVWDHKGVNHTLADDREFLERKGYEYAVLDDSCFQSGQEAVQKKFVELAGIYPIPANLSSQNFVVFKVK